MIKDLYNIFGIVIKHIQDYEYVVTEIHDEHRYANLFKLVYPDEFSFLITQHNNSEEEVFKKIYEIDSKTLADKTELYLLHEKEAYDKLLLIIRQFKINKLKGLSDV